MKRCELFEDAPCKVRIDSDTQHGRQDTIPPEHRAEPGDPGIGVRAERRVRRQGVEIRPRPPDYHVEELVRIGRLRRARTENTPLPSQTVQRDEKAPWRRGPSLSAGHLGRQHRLLVGVQVHHPRGPRVRQGHRLRAEGDRDHTDDGVKAGIGELNRRAMYDHYQDLAASEAGHAPNFKEVAEVARKRYVDPEAGARFRNYGP